MKLLARFDRVWAVSRGEPRGAPRLLEVAGDRGPSRRSTCWRSGPISPARPRAGAQGLARNPPRDRLRRDPRAAQEPGRAPRRVRRAPDRGDRGGAAPGRPREPALRAGELKERVDALAAKWPGLRHHPEMGDGELAALLASARATAFPSIAEGCGLPQLESLWMGVPCLCSDLPSLLENAAGGGCDVVAGNRAEGWTRVAAAGSSRTTPGARASPPRPRRGRFPPGRPLARSPSRGAIASWPRRPSPPRSSPAARRCASPRRRCGSGPCRRARPATSP